MAPFHRVGENPTLAFERDLDLIEHLDRLDFDEAWIGEHHSAGWELIASPELMIAAAAQRTRTIKLGTGVVSLPYHHPLMVADRMVQLDHMTRGRAMMGVGPGALSSDAYMMGIDPLTQRRRMDESLGAVLALMRGEIVNMKTDWFTLNEARLQLAPYSHPHIDVAVASTFSPAGPVTAGKHGVGMLSITASQPGGLTSAAESWDMLQQEATKFGKEVSRSAWRVLTSMHLADSREEAIADVQEGMTHFYKEYFGRVIGTPGRFDDWTFEGTLASGGAIIGTPDDAIEAVERILELTGGMGGLLFQAHEWTTWEKTRRSFELWARYVAPRFQGQIAPVERSRDWSADNRTTIFAPGGLATMKAFEDAGREVPAELLARMQRGRT